MSTESAPRQSELHFRRRVNFYEVDSAGIVHFSWFARYMEEAEHALWRAAGLSIAPPGSSIGFPRVAMTFDFRQPLRFEDEFDVHIRIVAIGLKSIRYACVVRRHEQPVATGSLTIACVERGPTMRAIPIPDEIRARFEIAAEADA